MEMEEKEKKYPKKEVIDQREHGQKEKREQEKLNLKRK